MEHDLADAAHWLTPAAEKGDAEAQYTLGRINDLGGTGVLQDRKRRRHWYQKAADQGNAEAQYRLGLLYEFGNGVPRISRGRWMVSAAPPPAATGRP